MAHCITLDNGLTLIVEEIPHVESAAYELHIPGGLISDQSSYEGAALLLAELTSRGAGEMDSRELSESYDALGARHSESGSHSKFIYRGLVLENKLPEALKLVASVVQQPTLPETELDNVRSLFLQDLNSLQDSPARWAMEELCSRYYPEPHNCSSLGTESGLKNVDRDHLFEEWGRKFRPSGSILSISGSVNRDEIRALAEECFGGWKGKGVERADFGELPPFGKFHVPSESAQLQIAMAYPSAPFGHDHYYDAKVATAVMSGGMHGRLFVEVREKRGLCYSVYSRHSSTNQFGTQTVYAGTTPERAHETLEVIVSELTRLKGTITSEELSRAKATLKSSLIIGEESTSGRASSNATDYWYLGRVRSLIEIIDAIDAVTLDSIGQYLSEFPSEQCSVLTLGAREI